MYNTLKLYRFNILIPLRANILRNWDYIRKWRLRKISDRQLVNILGVIVGFLSGLSAIILKNTVYYTHAFITSDFGFGNNSFLLFFSPLIGILLTVLFIRYFIKDDISHQGTVVSIDTNLPDITTCRVLWDDDNTHTPDVQWTNKLVVVKELDDLIVTLQDKSDAKEIRIETVLNKRNI